LVPLVGYAGVLAWFGTGLALAVRHSVSRVFLASTLIPPVSLAVFLLGWIARPEAIVRTWPIGGGLLLFASGIFAAVGSIAAIIGWWAWFREARARLPRRSR
jgi:hypothetical protein